MYLKAFLMLTTKTLLITNIIDCMTTQTQIEFKEAKYNIATLLRGIYGELGLKKGKKQLAHYCKLKDTRTVDNWLSIEAGEPQCINHLLIDKVLSFFNLQNESQLYTAAHNNLLKKETA